MFEIELFMFKNGFALNNLQWLICHKSKPNQSDPYFLDIPRCTYICTHTHTWLPSRLTAPLQRGKIPPNECTGYDTKQSDGEVPVMLQLWGMWSTPSLSLLPGSLWPGVVAPNRALSMGQTELNYVLMLNWIVSIGTVWQNWIVSIGTVWQNWIARNRNVFDN